MVNSAFILGIVYLNKYDGESKNWSERWKEKLERPSEAAEVGDVVDRFEFSLALDDGGGGGDGVKSSRLTLVVGAPGVPGSLSASGQVYVFVLDTSSDLASAVGSQVLSAPSSSSSAGYFGFSVSVSLHSIAVGDPFKGKYRRAWACSCVACGVAMLACYRARCRVTHVGLS